MYIEFEKGQKYAAKKADISNTCDHFQDAGYVLEKTDLVVDIDDLPKETIEKMLSIFNIKTQTVWTERGAHLYFKKPQTFRGSNSVCPLGFKVEYKHAANTKAITVKRDGALRKIDNEGIREELPATLMSKKKYDNLLGMDEGEGRNKALFRLRTQVADIAGWKKILQFVNDHVFATSLDREEYETVVRDNVIIEGKTDEYETAGVLLRELDFLKYGLLYFFKRKDKTYTSSEWELQNIIYDYVGKQNTRYIDEVMKQMKYRCRAIPDDEVFDIAFENGFLRNGEFCEVIKEEFTPYVIHAKYDPFTKPVEVVDDYIDHLTGGDKDYRSLLLEILGHTLVVDSEFKRLLAKFFIFEGKGGNGKGTLLQIIKGILGAENCTGMSIAQLSDERYIPSFKGKLANLGDDLQDQAIDDKAMKVLKNLTTCDFVTSRELYKGAESVSFTGSLIFTSNHAIKSWEKGESYKRRVLWLPMFTKVEKKDPLFITKLTTKESVEYWIKLIVEGYMRLYRNVTFTESKVVKEHNRRYHMENNPAIEFLTDYKRESIEGMPIRDIYDAYKDWCEDNALKANNKIIRETIEDIFDLEVSSKRINGKVAKCFMGKKEE